MCACAHAQSLSALLPYPPALPPLVRWWMEHYPRLSGPAGEGARLGMVECIQEPGDTIFVPAGALLK